MHIPILSAVVFVLAIIVIAKALPSLAVPAGHLTMFTAGVCMLGIGFLLNCLGV